MYVIRGINPKKEFVMLYSNFPSINGPLNHATKANPNETPMTPFPIQHFVVGRASNLRKKREVIGKLAANIIPRNVDQ